VATISGISSSGLSFSGLASGIDTEKIISGLTKLNQSRIDSLKLRQADFVSRQTTFVQLQAKLFDLQSKTNALARSAGSAFDGRKAESSDSNALSVSAGTAAVAGTYNLTVMAQARAHQTASTGFADPNAKIKEGTLGLRVGSGTEVTITVDSKNNTLQGLADSINAAGTDIRASIINDGTATPYRLVLTATRSGVGNAIALNNNLNTGTGVDIDPAATTVQAATDAQIRLGSGAGAIILNSATNQINGLIPGLSFNLMQADPARSITVTVSNNSAGVNTAIKDFVDSYNAIQDYLIERTSFDKDSGEAGLLLGNRDSAQLSDELSAALSASIPGLSTSTNRLSSVGLTFDEKGKLQFDSEKLNKAMSGANGSTLADVKRLFGLTGSSDSNGAQFVFGGDKTRPSNAGPYEVRVTSPATRAVAVATGTIGGSITISPPDNLLLLKLNGVLSTGITLDPGTYAPETLSSMIQQRINSAPSVNGNLVSVGVDPNGKLQIASQQYGAGSGVSFGAGSTALSTIGFTGAETSSGTDVVGSFLVNGQTELATGTGQSLMGASGNTNTSGLQVRATMTTPGSANITVTQGLASRLNSVISKYLDPINGKFKAINEGYQQNVDQITTTITKQNEMLDEKTAQLQLRFAAMESAVNQLKGLQSQLTSLIPTMSFNK